MLVPIFGCFWQFWHQNLKFRHEVGLKIKNAPGERCSYWPKEYDSAKKKKTGAGVESTLPASLTPEKYLGPEKVNVHPMRAGHILLQPMKSAGKSMGN